MPEQAGKAEMDQVRKQFVPYVLPIVVGTEVSSPDRDQIHHHVCSFWRTKAFELPLHKGEPARPLEIALDVEPPRSRPATRGGARSYE